MARRRDDPTRNFSRDMASRNKLLQAGEEAQWCIFDSILSVHFGQRYLKTKSADALEKQTESLNRALAQVTHADPPRCEAFRCPELYYHEQGRLANEQINSASMGPSEPVDGAGSDGTKPDIVVIAFAEVRDSQRRARCQLAGFRQIIAPAEVC